MSNDPRQKQPIAPVDQTLTDEKPPIEQPGPIIIKSGREGDGLAAIAAATGPVDVESPIYNFRDDQGRNAQHYVSERFLRISSLLYRDGDNAPVLVDFRSPKVRVVINMEP